MRPFLILFIELITLPLNFLNILLRHVYAVFSSINAMEKCGPHWPNLMGPSKKLISRVYRIASQSLTLLSSRSPSYG